MTKPPLSTADTVKMLRCAANQLERSNNPNYRRSYLEGVQKELARSIAFEDAADVLPVGARGGAAQLLSNMIGYDFGL